MDSFQGVTTEQLQGYEESYNSSPLCRAMTNALFNTSVNDAAFCHAGLAQSQHAFSIDLATLPVTN